MASFFSINGVSIQLGQGHVVVSGVDIGLGQNINIMGFDFNNSATNTLTPVLISRNFYADIGSACSFGASDMVTLYYNTKTSTLYTNSRGESNFVGTPGRIYYTQNGTVFSAPGDEAWLYIDDSGVVANGMAMPCAP